MFHVCDAILFVIDKAKPKLSIYTDYTGAIRISVTLRQGSTATCVCCGLAVANRLQH